MIPHDALIIRSHTNTQIMGNCAPKASSRALPFDLFPKFLFHPLYHSPLLPPWRKTRMWL